MQTTVNFQNLQTLAKQGLFETIENAVSGAITVNIKSEIVWINDNYLRFLGFSSKGQVVGKKVWDVIEGSKLPYIIKSGKTILLDLLEYEKGWAAVSRFPLKDSDGVIIGAFGFLLFGNLESIEPVMSKIANLTKELAQSQKKLSLERIVKYSLNNVIGDSDAIVSVKKQARQASNSKASMIISGETGTGKELIAQAIHSLSARSSEKFVAINVAAIPENLVEVEFFGAVGGAYTGVSKQGRMGKMQLANGGTLFLDEIADMPMNVQSKLLRVLQEREIEPVGSNKIIPIDIRVIAATSLNLEKLVAKGSFRADLYYRLNVIPIEIPPLRGRLDDIDLLCESILESISSQENSTPRFISDAAITHLKDHDWPGNVRELKNVLERASAMNNSTIIKKEDIATILDTREKVPIAVTGEQTSLSNAQSLSSMVAQYEEKIITETLFKCHNNKSLAADMLKMPRSSLYVKLKRYGL
ncbi:MAG: transcriptional regulator with PAS, ATPase and Fis domain [Oceanospirillaceae bacterium]|jgi:transcriptional regulator with PAS, ATPase and Fis domain